MAQRISNIYRLVTIPKVYLGFHLLLGSPQAKARVARELYRPTPGMAVLDVGCGPASLFPYLPGVQYTGIDMNPGHIAHARALYGDKGRFLVGDAAQALSGTEDRFDLVIASALLHHLDDDQSRKLFADLTKLAKPGGRIVTIDNVWLPRQNVVAKLLNKLDSGMNVRTPEQYLGLTAGLPLHVTPRVYRDLFRIPYDHFSMTLLHRHEPRLDG